MARGIETADHGFLSRVSWMILRLCVLILGIFLSSIIVPGIDVSGWGPLKAAVLLGLLNIFIRPALLLLTLPINFLTLGLFTFVLNAVMLWLTSVVSDALGLGFHVAGFGAALLGALVVSIVSFMVSLLVGSALHEVRERRP